MYNNYRAYLEVLAVCLVLISTSFCEEQKINIRVLQANAGEQCPSMLERERTRNAIHNEVVNSMIHTFGCDNTPGWRQIVFINMTNTSYSCPPGLHLTSYSKRTCGKSGSGCSSSVFSVGGIPYSRVCGRIRGYQKSGTNAFFSWRGHNQDIDGYYVDGISLTHGDTGRRQHIWTFASGQTEAGYKSSHVCPCDINGDDSSVPPFVGNDYFCESGLNVFKPLSQK